jgi:hypothetical protein
MAEKVTLEFEADTKGAVNDIGEIKDGVKDIGKTAKAQKGALQGMAKGFKGVGMAMKAAGFAIIMKLVNALWEAMKKNQQIADAVSTAFNVIGVVMGKITNTITNVVNRVAASSDNFDALGRIMKNFMTLALTPLKLAFNGIMLVIKQVQLAWEKSWLGKGDIEKIKRLTKQIDGYKQEIKDVTEEAIAAGKGIVVDFKEGIGEIHNLGKIVVEEFDNTFKNVTVSSLVNQAKAVTKATANLGLLEAKHQRVIIAFEKQAEEQRKIRDDISQSIDDRIAANDKLLVIAKEQAAAEIKALKDQKGALAAKLAVEVDNADIKAQLYALDTAILETEKRATSLDKESGEQKNALLAEQLANTQELNKIGIDEVERQEQEFINERDRLIKMAELTLSNAEELADAKLRIEENYQKKKDKLDEAELLKEQALQDNKRQIIGSALTGLTALVGAETKAGKGLAVAQATMDTYAGATKALAQGGIFGTIAAAGVIASGLANIRTILQTDIPGETGGGDSPPPTPEVVQDTIPTVPTFGAIGTEPPPVQAFVVESDVSSSQALQNDLNLQATL